MDDKSSAPTPASGEPAEPGKTRTWWHPLLVQMLSFVLSGAYEVIGELVVGKLPLSIDIFLVRRSEGRLSELGQREARVLIPLLRRYSFVEFKGPTTAMTTGDVSRLFACTMTWFGQQEELPPRDDLVTIFMAPTMNQPAADELKALGCQTSMESPGVHRIEGYTFAGWFLETDELAGREALMALVSRVFLRDQRGTIERYAGDHEKLLDFMLQQVEQFKTSEDFKMQFTGTETMEEIGHKLKDAVLSHLSPEERLRGLDVEERLRGLDAEERLRGLGTEERLRGLGAEERLRGLDVEERLRGLDAEDILSGLSEEQLAELLEQLKRKEHGE